MPHNPRKRINQDLDGLADRLLAQVPSAQSVFSQARERIGNIPSPKLPDATGIVGGSTLNRSDRVRKTPRVPGKKQRPNRPARHNRRKRPTRTPQIGIQPIGGRSRKTKLKKQI